MACCKSDKYGGWCKEQPTARAADGQECCVFHAQPVHPTNQKKSPVTGELLPDEEFNRLVLEEIERQRIIGKCDLSGTIFPGDISFKQYNVNNPLPEISFEDVKFKGVADFGQTKFGWAVNFHLAEFHGAAWFTPSPQIWELTRAQKIKASFHGHKFAGDADFSQAQFKGNASFYGVSFAGNVAFNGGTFDGPTSFREVDFIGKTNFMARVFMNDVDFRDAKFIGETQMQFAKFRKADFDRAEFREDTSFREAEFSHEVNFHNAEFNREVTFLSASIRSATFAGITFKEGARADFQSLKIENLGSLIENIVSFNGSRMRKPSFLGTDLNKCQFISCQWDEEDGRNILYDETEVLTVENEKLGEIRSEWQRFKTRHFYPLCIEEKRQVRNLYRKLKQKYRLSHDEFEASKWHASEKEMQRKGISINSLDWIWLNLYRLSSGYGENPAQALKMLGCLVLAAIIVMGVVGLKPDKESILAETNKELSPVYLFDNAIDPKLDVKNTLIIALTTIEYITFQKTTHYKLNPAGPWGTGFKILFLLLIYAQFTLFIFALRNRFRR